jgi:glycosyltransferase involved in cell wall biosynthesis
MPSRSDPGTEGSTLLVFTGSFPYRLAMEDTFIGPELPYLVGAFQRVILVPYRTEGIRAAVPAGIEVDETFAREVEAGSGYPHRVRRGALSRVTRQEILARPSLLLAPRLLRIMIGYSARAEMTRRWLTGYLGAGGRSADSHVAYSFWCDHVATGLALTKVEARRLVAVSRAHGTDVYPERHDPPYLPGRSFTYRHLDGVFPDSERATAYLQSNYPETRSNFRVARMGVQDPGFRSRPSVAGNMHVVSCSMVVGVKRVDLIAQAIASAAKQRPDLRFEWDHFGEGDMLSEVEGIARSILPSNAVARFPGYPGTSALMEFYRTEPVDVFVNASSSEGTPVAIMEAISCGIPVLATAVGGNTEIVSETNGALVPADASPSLIGSALLTLGERTEENLARRDGSRRVWNEQYNASINFEEFAGRLHHLRTIS